MINPENASPTGTKERAREYRGKNATVILNQAWRGSDDLGEEPCRMEDHSLRRYGFGMTEGALRKLVEEVVAARSPDQLQ